MHRIVPARRLTMPAGYGPTRTSEHARFHAAIRGIVLQIF